MIYTILRQLARIAFAVYFRRVYLINRHYLPPVGPVLLACNHPSAFMEPSVLSAWSRRYLYYLTRGDFFKKAWLRWLLIKTHQIPIYRTRDGFSNLRSNKESFEACYRRLAESKVIMIFPESRTILEKRLRPVQKGAARIAFGTTDAFPGTIPVIVPVGVTFTNPRALGGLCCYKYGAPINVEDYLSRYREQPQEALRQLTEKLEQSMKPLIVHLDREDREHMFDALWEVAIDASHIFPKVSEDGSTFDKMQHLARRLNTMSADEFAALQAITRKHTPGLLLETRRNERLHPLSGWLGLPGFLAGRLLNYLPATLTRVMIRKVRTETFQGPVKAVLGFFMHVMFYLVLGVLLTVWLRWMGALLGLALLMLGYAGYRFGHASQLWGSMKFRALPAERKAQLRAALKEIDNLLMIQS